jgi:hypothetical protein
MCHTLFVCYILTFAVNTIALFLLVFVHVLGLCWGVSRLTFLDQWGFVSLGITVYKPKLFEVRQAYINIIVGLYRLTFKR